MTDILREWPKQSGLQKDRTCTYIEQLKICHVAASSPPLSTQLQHYLGQSRLYEIEASIYKILRFGPELENQPF